MGKADVGQNLNPGTGGRRPDAPDAAPQAPTPDAPPQALEAPAPVAPEQATEPQAQTAPRPGKVFSAAAINARLDEMEATRPVPRADTQADAQPRPASQLTVEPKETAARAGERQAISPPPRPMDAMAPAPQAAQPPAPTPQAAAQAAPLSVLDNPVVSTVEAVEPTLEQKQPVEPVVVPRGRVIEVNDLIAPAPPGVADPLETVIPVPRAEPSKLPSTRFRPAIALQEDIASKTFGTHNPGTAIEARLEADPSIGLNEVGVPAEMLFRAYQNPASGLREILAADASIDQAQMSVPGYAIPRIMEFFAANDIEGLAEKRPTVDEASAHRRVVRATVKPSVTIHPIVGTVYNADYDGDTMKVSFDPEAVAGAKSAMDFLIGTEGAVKIDSDFFAMAPWGDGTEGVRARLFKMFQSETDSPLDLTDSELKGLAAAIEQSWSEDAEAGFRSLMRWCRAIGERVGEDRDAVTARVLGDIYRMNRDIRIAAKAFEGIWARYDGPVLEGDVVSDTTPPFPDLISQGGTTANLYDFGAMVGSPIGTVKKKNPHFRFGAGIAKGARERSDLFDPRTSTVPTDTAEDLIAMAMSGVDSLDESTRAVSDEARRMVLLRVGFPVTDSPEAFQAWLNRFAREHNRVVYAFNSAAARVNLDMTLSPYDDLSLPFIPTDDPVALRKALRTQFKNVFGGFTMGKVFGPECPRGWEKVTVEEFIQTNRMTDLGTRETLFDTPAHFISRLADLRTSFAHDFDDLLMSTLKKQMAGDRTRFFAIATRMQKAKKTGLAYAQHALDQDLEAVAEALYLMGPDVFYHLGLDSPDAFARTEIGRKFISARTADELGGVLFEAVARYRFAAIQRYRELWSSTDDAHERLGYERAFEHELNALASSSDTWAAIVHAYRDGLDIFDTVLFADLPMSRKKQMLNELVHRDPQGRPGQKAFEVAAGLFAQPKGRYAADRFSGDMGHTRLRANMTASSKAIDDYAKARYDDYVDSVKKARTRHEKAGRLMPFLEFVAKNPRELAVLEPWMIADAVLSSMEKTYDSSEKAKQEAEVNYIYSAVNNLINGGVWSDLAVGGDFALGAIALDRFQDTPAILARLLSDPEFSITVYDGTGDITLSRAVLLGSDHPKESDVWDWLEAHPRAAAALRRTAMVNTATKTGFSYGTATASLMDTISSTEKLATNALSADKRAMKELADHPGFYAMVSLATRMTGMKRSQLRDATTQTVFDVIRLLRSLSGDEVDMVAYVNEMMTAAGIDMGRVETIYQQGLAQEAEFGPLSEAPAEDVRDMYEYQLGQIRDRLASDLAKYSAKLADLKGIDPLPAVSPAQAAQLFHLTDQSTVRSYFDTIQVISSAKTQLSTAVNGNESRRNAGLMFLAQHVAEKPCDAPEPRPLPVLDFAERWDEYEGRMARVGEDLIPVSEVTFEEILTNSTDGMVYIEDPAACTDLLAACVRHATADPSTNLSGDQTTALGRLLTIVRTLSSEGLNLKSKTLGDDGTDSIVKNRVFDVLDNDTRAKVDEAFAQGGMPAARIELAKALQASFQAMLYTDEMSLDDYVNVAQLLVRPVLAEGIVTGVKVISVGQLNALVTHSLMTARNAASDGLDMDAALAAAVEGLTANVGAPLDVESVLAGFRPVSESWGVRSGIESQRQSSIGRNLALIEQIIAENDVKPFSDKQLDGAEEKLTQSHPDAIRRWKDIAGTPNKWGPGLNRYSYRIIGVVDASGARVTQAVGFRNAWVVAADSPKAAEAIIKAYSLGITVLLDGVPTPDVWKKIHAATAVIDENQLVPLDKGRAMLPMFDIRLNGANTAIRDGAVNAGTFHALPEQVYFYYESLVNEHSLSDSEFAPTESFVSGLRPKRTGEYRIPARAAFANLLAELKGSGLGYPNIRLATKDEVTEDILNPYLAETADDAPAEFDKKITIDTGTIRDEGSREDTHLAEGMVAYLARLGETGDDGLLREARPDEIIGWLRAQAGDEVAYHPIRPYELGHDVGTPASLSVEGVIYDTAREELVISWKHEGSMLGRSFKLFEALYAANKFMARSSAIADVTLKNGVKLAGYIAKQSTASRRLFMRRQQKMMTLMYIARMAPFGYNLAEKPETFPDDPDLKAGLLDASASIGMWAERLRAGDIAFFPSTMADMNALANDMARKAVRYGINPTTVFASRHNGVPSNIWFNFQVLFERGPYYQASLMKLLNYMMPSLVPAGLEDTGGTLFNKDLQVLVPFRYTDTDGHEVTSEHWVDLYGGFHFLDEHFTGYSGKGTGVKSDSLPTVNTLMAGGKRLTPADIDRYLDWGNIGAVNRHASPNWMLPDTTEEVL